MPGAHSALVACTLRDHATGKAAGLRTVMGGHAVVTLEDCVFVRNARGDLLDDLEAEEAEAQAEEEDWAWEDHAAEEMGGLEDEEDDEFEGWDEFQAAADEAMAAEGMEHEEEGWEEELAAAAAAEGEEDEEVGWEELEAAEAAADAAALPAAAEEEEKVE